MRAVLNRSYRQDFKPFTIVQGDIVMGKESNRRSGESRNPGNPVGKERAGYQSFWIPAFAGTTGLCWD